MNLEEIRATVLTNLLNPGGSNFETYVLSENKKGDLIFRPTPRLGLATTIQFIVVLSAIGFISYKWIVSGSFLFFIDSPILFAILFYFIFICLTSIYKNIKSICFSKSKGEFYIGFSIFSLLFGSDRAKLKDIVAIQILGEKTYNRDTNKNFNSFELNIVLNDASRIHVIDHNNLEGILDDAEKLSDYLNIPVWHKKSSEDSTSIEWED